MDIETGLREYIVNKFMQGEESGLLDDESLFDRGIIDSLGVLKLVAFLEEQYGVCVDDEELIPENFETIALLKEFIESKQVAAR